MVAPCFPISRPEVVAVHRARGSRRRAPRCPPWRAARARATVARHQRPHALGRLVGDLHRDARATLRDPPPPGPEPARHRPFLHHLEAHAFGGDARKRGSSSFMAGPLGLAEAPPGGLGQEVLRLSDRRRSGPPATAAVRSASSSCVGWGAAWRRGAVARGVVRPCLCPAPRLGHRGLLRRSRRRRLVRRGLAAGASAGILLGHERAAGSGFG